MDIIITKFVRDGAILYRGVGSRFNPDRTVTTLDYRDLDPDLLKSKIRQAAMMQRITEPLNFIEHDQTNGGIKL